MALLIPKHQKRVDEQDPKPVDPNNFSSGSLLKNKQANSDFQGKGILSNLDTNLKTQVDKNILGMASGDAFTPFKSANNEAFALASKDVASQSAGSNAPDLGQGSAVQSQQNTQNQLLQNLGQNQLQQNVEQAKMQQQGTELGLNLASKNEQQSQFLKNLEVKYTDMKINQENLLAQIGSSEFMQGKQIASNEKLAEDANYLKQQGIDIEHAKMFGYDKENGVHVSGALELNAMANSLDYTKYKDSLAWQSFNTAVMAGDFDGANALAALNGFDTIDWTNAKAKESIQKIGIGIADIEKQLETLGDDADPALVKSLAEQYGALFAEKQALLGHPFSNVQLDSLVKGISEDTINNKDYTPFEAYLDDTLIDWWSNGLGKNIVNQLEGKFSDMAEELSYPNLDPAEAEKIAEKLAPVIWAAYNQASGTPLTDTQKELLKSAGLATGIKEEEKADKEADLALYLDGTTSPTTLKGAEDPENEKNAVYKEIEANASPWNDNATHQNKSGAGNNGYYFDNPISKGQYIMYKGKLHYVQSDPYLSHETGRDHSKVSLIDVNSGELKTITAR